MFNQPKLERKSYRQSVMPSYLIVVGIFFILSQVQIMVADLLQDVLA
nr:MAG TPA: hypothetical protein [Caudoviricetes sp.]